MLEKEDFEVLVHQDTKTIEWVRTAVLRTGDYSTEEIEALTDMIEGKVVSLVRYKILNDK
jgi:hypothetical protein